MSSSNALPVRVLVLGGSSEASALVRRLAGRRDVEATLSLAGRTTSPSIPSIPTRIGGFGGLEGMIAYLRRERIDVLVDATHPFAARISGHARAAARRTGCRLVRVSRPAWRAGPGDLWREVASMSEAARAIGAAPRRVFLTIGRLGLHAFRQAPQHHYLVRTIDPVEDHGLVGATFVTARGPFELGDEERLLRDHRIDMLVTKNSGGEAASAKLAAARNLGCPVILLRRPDSDDPFVTISDAVALIESHRAVVPRGV